MLRGLMPRGMAIHCVATHGMPVSVQALRGIALCGMALHCMTLRGLMFRGLALRCVVLPGTSLCVLPLRGRWFQRPPWHGALWFDTSWHGAWLRGAPRDAVFCACAS